LRYTLLFETAVKFTRLLTRSPLRLLVLVLALTTVLSAVAGCRNRPIAEEAEEEQAESRQRSSDLVLNEVTLEQPDDNGDLLWRVVAQQATYDEKSQRAQVQTPKGQLFQDGKPIYEIAGDRGEIYQNGERLVVTGNVSVKDLRNGAILKGDEMTWLPQESQMTITGKLNGTTPRVQVTGEEATLYDQEQRLVITGSATAVTTRNPKYKLQAEDLVWQLDTQIVSTEKPVQVQRLNNQNQVTDRATGNAGSMNLETNMAELQGDAVVTLRDPEAQVKSDLLVWDFTDNIVDANAPVAVQLQDDRIDLKANSGTFDLENQLFYFYGNVQGVAQRDRSQLASDALTWNANSNRLVAEGNVNYKQRDPQMNVTGPRLDGTLENQVFVMSGGRVVTEIIPEGL
jgi:LPS export ABC transporter protein LptC